MKRLITLILFVSSLTMAAAQQVGVEAKIDSVAIMIGEQAHLQLTITARQGDRKSTRLNSSHMHEGV